MIENKDFVLPKFVKMDNEYIDDLKFELNNYLSFIKMYVSENCYQSISFVRECISSCLKSYYDGDIDSASNYMCDIIDCILKSDDDFISSIGKMKNDFISDNIVFKARCSAPDSQLMAEEMLHIPFDHREIVRGQRFSIPGCPCIYLGKTTYIDWLEMLQPSFNTFFVSPIEVDEKLKVFNLAQTNWMEIYGLANNNELDELSRKSVMFPLILATSYVVKDNNDRHFKSEYILSQLLMSCMAKYKVSGIAYLSKRSDDYSIIYPINLCYAFLANEDTDKCFRVLNPINMSIYLTMINKKNADCNFRYPDEFTKRPIYINGESQPYNETIFYEFDRYLKCKYQKMIND